LVAGARYIRKKQAILGDFVAGREVTLPVDAELDQDDQIERRPPHREELDPVVGRRPREAEGELPGQVEEDARRGDAIGLLLEPLIVIKK